MAKAKMEPRMRNVKNKDEIHKCPVCGSDHVNPVERNEYYCVNCCTEIKNGKAYTIL